MVQSPDAQPTLSLAQHDITQQQHGLWTPSSEAHHSALQSVLSAVAMLLVLGVGFLGMFLVLRYGYQSQSNYYTHTLSLCLSRIKNKRNL
jgi:hypothetical protein